MENSISYINDYATRYHNGNVICEVVSGKGRILRATKNFSIGDILFSEQCLHQVFASVNNPHYDKLVQICKTYSFSLDPLWYWCAMNSLCFISSAEKKAEMSETSLSNIILTNYPEYLQRIDEETCQRLRLLYKPEDIFPGSEVEILINQFNLHQLISPKNLEEMIQIWVHNCFDASDYPPGFAIYLMPSFCSHSCLPNALWRLENEGQTFILSARMNIEAGDEITLSYIGEETLLEPAYLRQEFIETTKSFICSCPRCTAQADLSRGFTCPNCKKGVIYFHPDSGTSRDKNKLLKYSTEPIDSINYSDFVTIDAPLHSSDKLCEAYTLISDTKKIIEKIQLIKPFICYRCHYHLTPFVYRQLRKQERRAVRLIRNHDQQELKDFEKFDYKQDESSDESVEDFQLDEKCSNIETNCHEQSIKKGVLFLDIEALSPYIAKLFNRHWIGFKFETYQTTAYYKKTEFVAAMQHSVNKLNYLHHMYYPVSGCLAWSYEELGELYLLSKWGYAPHHHWPPECYFTINNVNDFLEDSTCFILFTKAWKLLRLLFGDTHEYSIEVKSKIHAIEDFLQAACKVHNIEYPGSFCIV